MIEILKRKFLKSINKKLMYMIAPNHIKSVIEILMDEIISDLRDGKEIKLPNFGVLYMNKENPKQLINLKRERDWSRSKNKLKLKLSYNLKKQIALKIDQEIGKK